MPTEEWKYLVNEPTLRVQRNPDDPDDINFDCITPSVYGNTYWTVKFYHGKVIAKHPNHLKSVAEQLDLDKLPPEIRVMGELIKLTHKTA